MVNLISNPKVQNLKHLLGDDMNTEEGVAILQEWKNPMLYQGALYHHQKLAGNLEEVISLVVLWLIKWLVWTDVTKMLDTRVSS